MPNASNSFARQAGRGVTLLEMALAMMILAILSVAVSNLVRNGVESQMSQRTHDNMQTIAMNVVDDLRFDIRTASAATITSGGSRLELTPVNGGGKIIYELVGNDFRRSVQGTGSTKVYNTGFKPQLKIACMSPGGASIPCFEGWQTDDANPGNMVATSTNPRQIRINNITVQQLINGGTLIDQNFGVPNFPIRGFAFDLMSATEFQ